MFRITGQYLFYHSLAKYWKKCIHAQISDYLDERVLLSDKQHGFRKAHSTIYSAAQLVEYVNQNLDLKRPTLAAYIDFRKAFDCVQHDVLIDKFGKLNLHCSIVDWAWSYLSGREQRVFANNCFSGFKLVTQGVPQAQSWALSSISSTPTIYQHCSNTVHLHFMQMILYYILPVTSLKTQSLIYRKI